MRQETGRRRETGGGTQEVGHRRRETGARGSQETGDGDLGKTGDRRRETGDNALTSKAGVRN